jgi:predicted ester cyclase
MASPLEVVREWRRRQGAGETATLGEVVDLEGYTENCLGLTGWTTGYEIASGNYVKNMIEPWSDLKQTVEEVVESEDAVVIRQRIEATQVGEFLGIHATGRRVAWDAVTIVHVKDGRVVGAWIQPDLWGIHQQLTGHAATP